MRRRFSGAQRRVGCALCVCVLRGERTAGASFARDIPHGQARLSPIASCLLSRLDCCFGTSSFGEPDIVEPALPIELPSPICDENVKEKEARFAAAREAAFIGGVLQVAGFAGCAFPERPAMSTLSSC